MGTCSASAMCSDFQAHKARGRSWQCRDSRLEAFGQETTPSPSRIHDRHDRRRFPVDGMKVKFKLNLAAPRDIQPFSFFFWGPGFEAKMIFLQLRP